MAKNIGFRSWFYFRMGWSLYFAFIFAAVNTMVVTYYLAIERAPILQGIFPSFISYVLILASIGIPILVLVGYIHYRRTAAFGSEAEIQVESNPYYFRSPPGYYQQVIFPILLHLADFMVKYTNNEKLTQKDITEISEIQKKLNILIKGGMVGSPRKVSKSLIPKEK